MSFILDALKKSEIDRQRQSVPGLMDTRPSPRRSRLALWAVALGVLLGINLLVLSYVLMRKAAPAAQESRPADAAPPAGAAAVPPLPKPFSPLDAAPVYAPEIPVAAADDTAPLQLPARTAAPGGTSLSALHFVRHADPVLSDADVKTDTQEVLPSISELSLTGAQALPELHLDVHVYATQPAERFVYINMRKYHEGGALPEGPAVERIRRDGVVLNYLGLRFLLPRQP